MKITKEELEKARHIVAVVNGQAGGRARAEKLNPKRRRNIARKAAAARWGKTNGGK